MKYKQGNLLNHPLVMSLIYQKWQKFGRLIYYSKLSIYFLFLTFLTGYVIVSNPLLPRMAPDPGGNGSVCTPVSDGSSRKKDIDVIIFMIVGRLVVLGLGALQLLMEVSPSIICLESITVTSPIEAAANREQIPLDDSFIKRKYRRFVLYFQLYFPSFFACAESYQKSLKYICCDRK